MSFKDGEDKIRIVKARAGDTIKKLAERNQANPPDVAIFNGLLPESILSEGREIRIPSTSPVSNRISDRNVLSRCVPGTSPEVQNLKLGMTQRDVEDKLRTKLLLKKTSLPGALAGFVRNLDGLFGLSVAFYHGKLYFIDVFYNNSIKWSGLTEFRKTVANRLRLPLNSWNDGPAGSQGIYCGDFSLSVYPNNLSTFSVLLLDNNVMSKMSGDQQLLDAKKRRAEDLKKNTFKP